MKKNIYILSAILIFSSIFYFYVFSKQYASDSDVILGDTAYKAGDVDGNGKVEVKDYIAIRKHQLGIVKLSGDNLKRADVDGKNGVKTADYIIIRKIILGIDVSALIPTVAPTTTATIKPTATTTVKPTATATIKPTATATVKPTATATIKPTATATVKPTATATIKPTATATVKPTSTPIAVTEVKINQCSNDIYMYVGDTQTLTAAVSPNNATNKSLKWESMDTSVVTVDQNGKIIAKKAGSTNVSAKANNNKAGYCTIYVKPAFDFDQTHVDIPIKCHKVVYLIGNYNISDVTVTISNNSVSFIGKPVSYMYEGNDNSRHVSINGDKVGTATVTAKHKNGKTTSFTVTVKDEITSCYSGWHKENSSYYYYSLGNKKKDEFLTGYQSPIDSSKTGKFYLKSDGKMCVSEWLQNKTDWYYCSDNGTLAKGWLMYQNEWYYLSEYDYKMYKNGAYNVDGSDYYFDTNGKMLTDYWEVFTNLSNYKRYRYYGEDGKRYISKWKLYGSDWYYFSSDGISLASVTKTINGKSYTFNGNGVCTKGC